MSDQHPGGRPRLPVWPSAPAGSHDGSRPTIPVRTMLGQSDAAPPSESELTSCKPASSRGATPSSPQPPLHVKNWLGKVGTSSGSLVVIAVLIVLTLVLMSVLVDEDSSLESDGSSAPTSTVGLRDTSKNATPPAVTAAPAAQATTTATSITATSITTTTSTTTTTLGGPSALVDLPYDVVASTARGELDAGLPRGVWSVPVVLVVEPGTPELARRRLDEGISRSIGGLGAYLKDASQITVIGLLSQEWGVEAIREALAPDGTTAEQITEHIISEGFGESSGRECTGMDGVAFSEPTHHVVVVDIGASCNWFPSRYTDTSEAVIPHEMMHVAQYVIGGYCATLPVWFGEGQADFVAWHLSSADGVDQYDALRSMSLDPVLLSEFSSLDELKSYTPSGLEYHAGSFAIELLVARHGWKPLLDLSESLRTVGAQCSGSGDFAAFEESFARIFGYSSDAFSAEVSDYLSWLTADFL